MTGHHRRTHTSRVQFGGQVTSLNVVNECIRRADYDRHGNGHHPGSQLAEKEEEKTVGEPRSGPLRQFCNLRTRSLTKRSGSRIKPSSLQSDMAFFAPSGVRCRGLDFDSGSPGPTCALASNIGRDGTLFVIKAGPVREFDLTEVVPAGDGTEWNENVAARLLYKVIGWALRSSH
jgi:hypothetical protein